MTGLEISNPNGPCIKGSGVSNVHIYNNKIGPCGSGWDGVGVEVTNAHDVKIEHKSFDDVASALYAVSSTNNIVFDRNYATRIRGPYPHGQLVQFDKVVGSGHQITCNVSDQTNPGYKSGTEDHVILYYSSGTASSPIQVKYNKIRGGGPSTTGGGLLAGDGGGSYITIESNILVNPGQYGIGIAGGHYNKLLNNKVYSDSFAWTNVGAYVWRWNASEGDSYGHEVSGNRVSWKNKSGAANNWWDGGNSGTITMNGNVFGDGSLTAAIWNESIAQCQ